MLVNDMHFQGHTDAIDCVLRRCVEVKLQRPVFQLLLIVGLECQLSLAVEPEAVGPLLLEGSYLCCSISSSATFIFIGVFELDFSIRVRVTFQVDGGMLFFPGFSSLYVRFKSALVLKVERLRIKISGNRGN